MTVAELSTIPPRDPNPVYITFIANEATHLTKNLHLEHPEDEVLTGNRDVLSWLTAASHTSVKLDGSVAIVWGTNPENGKFFVGKKSVFNKVKVQICYTHADIEGFYGDREDLAEILHTCLDFLPRTEGIYQGDWLGYGGESAYKPNTIVYDFGEEVTAQMIVAPHTVYTGDTIATSVASPLLEVLEGTDDVLFVQPTCDSIRTEDPAINTIQELFGEATFLSPKKTKQVKPIINAFIREGKMLTVDILSLILEDVALATLYLQIMRYKSVMMENVIIYDGPAAFADGEPIDAEGYVRSNQYGTMKLVERYLFSRINFNNTKFA